MALIADILLIAGALGAAAYCIVLSRRLTRFSDLEKGVGGAIAVLSAQVDDLTRTLEKAEGTATQSNESLKNLTGRAEDVARRLELMVASMHDLPPAPTQPATPPVSPPSPAPNGAAHAPPAGDEAAATLFLSHRNRVGQRQ